MFQDKNIEDDFSALSSEKQAEVADFIQFLRQKQKRSSSSQIDREKAAELLLGKNAKEDAASFQLWDEAVNNECSAICAEPFVDNY